MRLLILPISTRQSLVYYQRWQRNTGNGKRMARSWREILALLPRRTSLSLVPFQETGLKTIYSPNSADETRITVLYPARLMSNEEALARLRYHATQGQSLHFDRKFFGLFLAPLSIPWSQMLGHMSDTVILSRYVVVSVNSLLADVSFMVTAPKTTIMYNMPYLYACYIEYRLR